MMHKTQIGVCMDYSIAYLLEEKNEEKVITIIEANDEIDEPVESEMTPLRRRRKDPAFFKKVFEIVKDFDKVLLFGPTSAKKELINRIKAHKLFNIKIQDSANDEAITENEKIEFINNYFDN